MHKFRHPSGFTLIELMAVVATIGILAAIGYPSYMESIRKSRRADAKAALLALQLAEEKFRANCWQYADQIAGAYGCVGAVFALVGSTTSPDGYYTLSIPFADASTYTLTATVTGDQVGDINCTTMSIDQAGNKTSTDHFGADSTATGGCWK